MVKLTDKKTRRYLSWITSLGYWDQTVCKTFDGFVIDFVTFGPSDVIGDTCWLVLISVVETIVLLLETADLIQIWDNQLFSIVVEQLSTV